ncbi:MAG TPA: hypothetical protein VFW66_06700 [Gemmatimonadales bacterium]|nr:hypothetical protein [Gemmatimonadales bacterium]
MEEVLRAVGTILVSAGMLLLLHDIASPLWDTVGEVLLVDALACFVAAFVLGRRAQQREREAHAARAAAATGPRGLPGDAPSGVGEPVSPDTSSPAAPPHTS